MRMLTSTLWLAMAVLPALTSVQSGPTAAAVRPWRPAVISADSAAALPHLPLRAVDAFWLPHQEELVYTVRYGFIAAGEARLSTQPGPSYGGRPTMQVVGTGRTTGAFDWVFKVRDHYESHVDKSGLFPHRFIRKVKEGGYQMDRKVVFDPARRSACTQEKGEERFQVLPDYCQDLVSAFHYARNLPLDSLRLGGIVEIPTFVDGKVHQVRARKMGEQQVDVKAGSFQCWVFQPLVKKGRIWKDEEDLTLYVSADARRMPVLVKSNLLVGSVRLELIEHHVTPTAPIPQ